MTGFGDQNLKMPLILALSVLISSLTVMLSRVEHEKCFITSGPGLQVIILLSCSTKMGMKLKPSINIKVTRIKLYLGLNHQSQSFLKR